MVHGILGASRFVGLMLMGVLLALACSSCSSTSTQFQSASDIRVIKYELPGPIAGAESRPTIMVRGKTEVAKVVQLLGSKAFYPGPTASMTQYQLEFLSPQSETVADVQVLGLGAEWYEQKQKDRLYVVTPELMQYLDGLFK